MTEWHTAVGAIGRLGIEAAESRGRASAIEARDAAREPMEAAQAEVDAALDAYSATAGPEAEAIRRATEARHQFEIARDELAEAQRNGTEPAVEIELDMKATSAAKVDERHCALVLEAQAVREQTKRQLDATRARLAQAKAALASAEEAISHPLQAPDRPLNERFEALLLTWPLRAALRHTPGYEVDDKDLAIIKELCQIVASDLGVMPRRLAAEIRDQAAREASADVSRRYQAMELVLPGGQVTSLGRLGANVRGPGQG
jgi:hypothetical protein